MGGKALNKYGVFTERKNTKEFNQIGYELITRVFFDLTLFSSVVTCYRTKADHGDLDLLIKVPAIVNVNWKEYANSCEKGETSWFQIGEKDEEYRRTGGFKINFDVSN